MYIPLISFFLLSLITQAAAQFQFPDSPFIYDAPPLEVAVLGVEAFLTLATLIQLIIVSTFLIRGRSPHTLPAGLIALGMLFSLITYMLTILDNLAVYQTDGQLLPETLSEQVVPALLIFDDFADPLIYVGVALIVRDRYRTHRQTSGSDQPLTKPLPIELFMIPFYVLAAFDVIFSSANVGVVQTLPTLVSTLTDPDYEAQLAKLIAGIKAANGLLYTAETMYCLATVMLIPLAALVRSRIRRDSIMNLTMFAIIPFLCLRFLPQIAIFVEEAKTQPDLAPEAIDLLISITDGGFYFIVFCFFSHIFMWMRLWRDPGPSEKSYGYMGGQMPLTQFPVQWGSYYPQGGPYTPGMQYPPAQGQFQGVYSLPQTNGQNPGSGQVTQYQYPLTQTQQVSGPEKEMSVQPAQ